MLYTNLEKYLNSSATLADYRRIFAKIVCKKFQTEKTIEIRRYSAVQSNLTSDYISKIIDFKVHVGDRKKVLQKSRRIFGSNIWRQIDSNTGEKLCVEIDAEIDVEIGEHRRKKTYFPVFKFCV